MAQKEYMASYEKENLRQIRLKINRKTEPDILEWIEKKDNIQGYIKKLILQDMWKEKSETEPKVFPETRYEGKTIGCEKCGHEITDRNWKVCPYCRRTINWEKEKDR